MTASFDPGDVTVQLSRETETRTIEINLDEPRTEAALPVGRWLVHASSAVAVGYRYVDVAPEVTTPVTVPIIDDRGPLSTRSFTNRDYGTDPNTVAINLQNATMTVDLTALAGAEIVRATLDLFVAPTPSGERYDIRAGNEPLTLLAPRYVTFDATDAVRAAGSTLELSLVNISRGIGSTVALSVTARTPPTRELASVRPVTVTADSGDTFIAFEELDPPHTSATWTVGPYQAALAEVAEDVAPKTRYRIYRSPIPITKPAHVALAELVDEIPPLSGWNGLVNGFDPDNSKNGDPIVMLPIANDTRLAPGSGLYVRRTSESGRAYYFVSAIIDGAEDFSGVDAPAVDEVAGPGALIRDRSERFQGPWIFTPDIDMTLHYFVKWEGPPHWNVPSQPFNYRLGVPEDQPTTPPLTVQLHAWGGDFNGWSRWYGYDDGALLLTSNLLVYSEYTAFSESRGTLRSWTETTAQPYFHARMLALMRDHIQVDYPYDEQRVMLFGGSMGGSGTNHWGLRSGHIFSDLVASVPAAIPAEDATWMFERWAYGRRNLDIRFSNEQLAPFGYPVVRPSDDVSVWDYFDSTQWLANNPQAETPFVSFANAPNDPAIRWEPAWKHANAMIETKRPHAFLWNQEAHGATARPIGVAMRRNRSVPAFTNGSLDDDLGASHDVSPPIGQKNAYLLWDPETIDDVPGRWAIDVWLRDEAPQDTATVDLTPRRLQSMVIMPGTEHAYVVLENEVEVVSGTATSDDQGILTITGVPISKSRRQIVITAP